MPFDFTWFAGVMTLTGGITGSLQVTDIHAGCIQGRGESFSLTGALTPAP